MDRESDFQNVKKGALGVPSRRPELLLPESPAVGKKDCLQKKEPRKETWKW